MCGVTWAAWQCSGKSGHPGGTGGPPGLGPVMLKGLLCSQEALISVCIESVEMQGVAVIMGRVGHLPCTQPNPGLIPSDP